MALTIDVPRSGDLPALTIGAPNLRLDAKVPRAGRRGVVIREFETVAVDAASRKIAGPPGAGHRLVYAAILACNYP